MTLLLLWLTLALSAAPTPVLDEALSLRDAFEHDRAIQVLEGALDEVPSQRDALLRWHLGVLLAEARRVEEARARFAEAAGTGVAPELLIEVSPDIRADINAAIATAAATSARPEEPEPETPPENDPVAGEPRSASPTPPAAGEAPSPGVPLLGIAAASAATLGGVIALGGVAAWGAGLGLYASALEAQSQTEIDALNEAAAPLQLFGQIAALGGLVLLSAGGAAAWLLWE